MHWILLNTVIHNKLQGVPRVREDWDKDRFVRLDGSYSESAYRTLYTVTKRQRERSGGQIEISTQSDWDLESPRSGDNEILSHQDLETPIVQDLEKERDIYHTFYMATMRTPGSWNKEGD